MAYLWVDLIMNLNAWNKSNVLKNISSLIFFSSLFSRKKLIKTLGFFTKEIHIASFL